MICILFLYIASGATLDFTREDSLSWNNRIIVVIIWLSLVNLTSVSTAQRPKIKFLADMSNDIILSSVTKMLSKSNSLKAAIIATIFIRGAKTHLELLCIMWQMRDSLTADIRAEWIKGWLNIKRESICKFTAPIRRQCLWCNPPRDSLPSIFTHLIKLKA